MDSAAFHLVVGIVNQIVGHHMLRGSLFLWRDIDRVHHHPEDCYNGHHAMVCHLFLLRRRDSSLYWNHYCILSKGTRSSVDMNMVDKMDKGTLELAVVAWGWMQKYHLELASQAEKPRMQAKAYAKEVAGAYPCIEVAVCEPNVEAYPLPNQYPY